MKTSSGTSAQQNVCFHDADSQWVTKIDSMPDTTFSQGQTPEVSLAEFLSRPVKIFDQSWQVDSTLTYGQPIKAWENYFTHPAISAKTAHFNLLRCNLNIKILINGSPMHYGRAMVAYEPFEDFDHIPFDSNDQEANLVRMSQMPHVFLDPTKAQGGTMVLPFFHLHNWIHPWNMNELEYMGALHLVSFGPLKSIADLLNRDNGVTITIFAWASEVELCVPTIATQNNQLFEKQSGKDDEYGKGPISRVATAVARVASKLIDIPVIGPYARATAIGSSAIGSIAAMFGFSRPVVALDPIFVKNQFMGNMSNTNTHESVTKLSMDIKQELTIDPRTVGLGDIDELTIKSITERETYITSFPWEIEASAGAPLFTISVGPVMYRVQSDFDGPIIATPLAMVSQLFDSWSGTIVYRFQIVASQFHRGRIRVTWDPTDPSVGGSDYDDPITTNFCRIIDLAECRDFEIAVGWGQAVPYLETDSFPIDQVPNADLWANGISNILYFPELSNGILAVHVLNELASGNVNNDISVNVFTRAGEDFEFGNPTANKIRQISYFPPFNLVADPEPLIDVSTPLVFEKQSGNGDGWTDPTDDNPDVPAETIVIAPSYEGKEKSLIFFGEKIESLRTYLKRYYQHMIHSPPNYTSEIDDVLHWKVQQHMQPLYRGFDPEGVHRTSSGLPYNYVNTTLMTYLTPCYIGRRGGQRYKFIVEGRDPKLAWYLDAVRLTGHDLISPGYASTVSPLLEKSNSASQDARLWQNTTRSGGAGRYATMIANQPCAEIELPFYAKERFHFARRLDASNPQGYDQAHNIVMQVGVHGTSYDDAGNDTAQVAMNQFISAGEDYTLFFFLNVPPMWVHSSPPAATS